MYVKELMLHTCQVLGIRYNTAYMDQTALKNGPNSFKTGLMALTYGSEVLNRSVTDILFTS